MTDLARESSEHGTRQVPAGMAPGAAWRDRLLRGLLIAAAVIGLPLTLLGSLSAMRDGQMARVSLYVGAYVLVGMLLLIRNWAPRWVTAGSFLGLAYLLAFDALRSQGLPGSGRLILLGLAAIAAVLYGRRGGLIALVLTLVPIAGIGWGMTRGSLPIAPGVLISADPASWASATLEYALLGGVIVVVLGGLSQSLERTMRGEQQLHLALELQRKELTASAAENALALQRSARGLAVVAEIARTVSRETEAQPLLSLAVERLREQLGFYHVSVFLVDSPPTWAGLTASTGDVGRQLLARRHRLAVGSASIVGWVTANRLPRVAQDAERDPFYFPNPLLPETRSEAAVPLIVGQEFLGVLDVQSTEREAFRDEDLRTLEAVALVIAVRLSTSGEMQTLRSRLEQVENLARGRVQESWARLTRAGGASVLALDPDGELSPADASSADSPTIRRASATRSTAISPDGLEAAVPVLVRGELVATLSARKPGGFEPWSEEEVALVEAIAAQTSLGIENARQYAEEQRRLAELEVLNRISQAVSQMLRLDSLFRVIHAQINQIFGQTDLFLAFYDAAANQISLPYLTRGGEEAGGGQMPLGDDLVSVVIRSRTPLLLVERVAEQAAQLGARLEDPVPQSWLGVPMMVGEDIVGVLAVEDRTQPRRYSEDDAALLSTIASQVAAAIQNARLLEQVQRSARRERLIHEIAGKVRRSPDFKSILETTARELGRALNAARASVRLEMPEAAVHPAGDGDGGPPPDRPVEEPPR